jgi:predicted CXXCH cytochrome family protein
VKLKAAAAVIACVFSFVAPGGAEAVHDEIGKVSCLECHRRLPFKGGRILFSSETGPACKTCHNSYHGSKGRGTAHPENIVPSMRIPPDMPLDSNGKTTCITCHTYHTGYKDESGKKLFFLRRAEVKTLCFSCHDNGELKVLW